MSFNQAFMAPLIGNEEHPGTLPRLYVYFFDDEEVLLSLVQSIRLFSTGFVLALLVAIPLGIVMARLITLRIALENYILALYVTPMIALIPFFPILYNTLEGARSVKPELIEVARSFRSSEIAIWRDILIPYTLPHALTGIRQVSGRALVGAVIAEFFVSLEGVGMYVLAHARSFKHNEAVVGVLALVLFGLLFELTINWVMRRYFPWYRREGRGE